MIGISLAFSATLVPKLESGDDKLTLSKYQTSWIGLYIIFQIKNGNVFNSTILIDLFIQFYHHKASVIVLSVPVGCLISAVLMEWLGRLNTVKLAAIPCVIGWALIASGSNFIELLIGRILTGYVYIRQS